jgi:hypothetical protein
LTIYRRIGAAIASILLGLGLAAAIPAPAFADDPAFGPMRITLGGYGGKCLDVTGVSTDNGALLQLYDCLPNQWNQQWYFYAKPGCFQCYQVVARHSGRCMDVVGYSTTSGALVQQYDCLGYNQLNQIWQLTSAGNGYFTLVAMHSYMYLRRDNNFNGSEIYQSTTNNNNLWYASTYLG